MKKRLVDGTMGVAAWTVGVLSSGMGTMRLRCSWLRMLRAMGDVFLRACPSIYDGQDNHKRRHASGRVRDRRRTEALYSELHEAEGSSCLSAREILARVGVDPERRSQLTEEFAREAFGAEAADASEVVVQYSGGADSTCAAILAALLFDRVHLMTFSSPFVTSVERSSQNARKLAAMFPQRRIEHHQIDAGEGLNELLFGSYLTDLRRYGTTPIGWPCLACKMSFDIETARFALSNDITLIADGSDLRVEYQLSQGDRTTLGLRDEWFRSHGMTFVHPVAAIEDTVTELLLFGAERNDGVLLYPQQGCCIGNDMLGTAYKRFYYIPRFGIDRLRRRAVEWMHDKHPVCDGMLNGQRTSALQLSIEAVDCGPRELLEQSLQRRAIARESAD